MTKIKIFISRSLSQESPFWTLDSTKYEIIPHSMIGFSPVHFELPQATDWVFFYSKNAVKYFFDQADVSLYKKKPKYACIGLETAKSLKSRTGISAHYIADGINDEAKLAFKSVVGSTRVLFPRAVHSRKTFHAVFPTSQIHDLIVYENTKAAKIALPISDILIFTSPLNATYYIEDHKIHPHQKIIAIGHSTAEFIKTKVSNEILISSQPSELALKILVESL